MATAAGTPAAAFTVTTVFFPCILLTCTRLDRFICLHSDQGGCASRALAVSCSCITLLSYEIGQHQHLAVTTLSSWPFARPTCCACVQVKAGFQPGMFSSSQQVELLQVSASSSRGRHMGIAMLAASRSSGWTWACAALCRCSRLQSGRANCFPRCTYAFHPSRLPPGCMITEPCALLSFVSPLHCSN